MQSAPLSHISIILVRPQHSGNIGAIARSIANHGLGQLILVNPPAFDPDCARWMAPNAHHIINQAKIVADVPSAIKNVEYILGASARNRSFRIPQVEVSELCQKSQTPTKIGLMFGPEDAGLSNEDLQHCHGIISLHTHEHKSLNLSQAVNVFGGLLMENLAGKTKESSTKPERPSMEMQQRMIETAMNTLHKTSFMSGKNPVHVQSTLFQLLGKTELSIQDAVFLKSICDKTYHAIRVLEEKQTDSKNSGV